MKRPYLAKHGGGIELSSANNAQEIMQKRADLVVTSLHGTEKTSKILLDRHGKELSAGTRDALERTSAFFATMRLQAKNQQKALLPAKSEEDQKIRKIR
jgi:hypothetical protein